MKEFLNSLYRLKPFEDFFWMQRTSARQIRLNNLVSKTLRRSLLAGDVVYELQKDGPYEVAVRVHGLEDVNPKKEMH